MSMTDSLVPRRDYSLTGPESRRAVEIGLASAEWYHSEVPRKVMKELMQRRDGPAIRDTILWLGLLVVSGAGGVMLWGSWWCVPFWIVYGVLYGSACDSRWHECGHGTAFRTQWMNDVVYQIASFMVMRNPVSWRWSHARHHTDTIIVGRDPEIAFMHPTGILPNSLHFVGILDIWHWMKILLRNAAGNLSPDERRLHPGQRSAQGHPRRPHPHRHLRGHAGRHGLDARLRCGLGLAHPVHADRRPAHLRHLAHVPDRPDPARRAGRGCGRPPPEQPHGLHEPDQPLDLLEHELPRRASHVSRWCPTTPCRACTS